MENQNMAKHSVRGLRNLKVLWPEMGLFERFEYVVMLFVSLVLAVIILVALFQLVGNVYQLAISQLSHQTEFKAFQTTFGMLLTLLITIEFRNSINAVLEGKGLLIQVKIVVLIAIIALARKFLVLDPEEYGPGMIAAFAGLMISLGLVYWLLGKKSLADDDLVRR